MQICGEKYRITCLSESLIRFEWDETGKFFCGRTQMVVNRNFPPVKNVKILDKGDTCVIEAKHIRITYDKKPFSPEGLFGQMQGDDLGEFVWRYGRPVHTLKGTARTLDEADGAIALEEGLCSRYGFSVLDDKAGFVVKEDGTYEKRPEGIEDFYLFAHGYDYEGALSDFYTLSGEVPRLPRFVFGNWWSRYYRYTEESYLELLDQMEKEDIPLSVAVLDMDWHLTDIPPACGSGWTGYTFNEELFPDPEGFLKKLHDRNLKVTLNVHPAEGVGAHEKAYEAVRKLCPVQKGEPVPFDVCNPAFMEAYFTCLHHPLEKMGTDFFWIDWQQGSYTRMKGLDPLWVLNAAHYADSQKNGKRGLIFSRYAGPGSHRYPVGFSGDTVISWASLDFQPYFTLSASNIGYGYWSHDIGGHMLGTKDEELLYRWVQLGVWSPILRLHASSSAFLDKAPWKKGDVCRRAMGEALRLRHRLIPYLYTLSTENLPPVRPLYYMYPREEASYKMRNEYFLGPEVCVSPITKPEEKTLMMAEAETFLPAGRYMDLYSGRIYTGGRELPVFRDAFSYPVFLKEGGILPLNSRHTGTQNPEAFDVYVFPGQSGTLALYEDAGDGYGEALVTKLAVDENGFCVGKGEGNFDVSPKKRDWCVKVPGRLTGIRVRGGSGFLVHRDAEKDMTEILVQDVKTSDGCEVLWENRTEEPPNIRARREAFERLDRAEIAFSLKEEIFGEIEKSQTLGEALSRLAGIPMADCLRKSLNEVLSARYW